MQCFEWQSDLVLDTKDIHEGSCMRETELQGILECGGEKPSNLDINKQAVLSENTGQTGRRPGCLSQRMHLLGQCRAYSTESQEACRF